MTETGWELVLAAALLTGGLTGCLQQGDPAASAEDVTLRRVVEATVETTTDSQPSPSEPGAPGPGPGPAGLPSLEDAEIDAWFVYLHSGDELEASEVTVRYAPKAQPDQLANATLADFTQASTVQPGDQVEIDGVHPVSPITVEGPDGVLGEREIADVDWITVSGQPAPLAVEQGGHAVLEATRSLGFDVTVEDANVSPSAATATNTNGSGPEWVHVNRLQETLDLSADQRIEVEAPETDRLSLDTTHEGEGDGHLEVDAENPNETLAATVDAIANATVDADATLTFQGGFEALQSTSYESSLIVDGNVTLEQTAPEERTFTPPPLREHPWMEDSVEGEEVPPEEVDSEGPGIARQLWGLTLDVGDTLRVNYTAESAAGTQDTTIETQVVDREDKSVPEGPTIDSFRISQTVETTLTQDGETEFERQGRSDLWIAADSYLPVFHQSNTRRSFDAEALAERTEAVNESLTDEQQEQLDEVLDQLEDANLDLVVESDSRLAMTTHEPGLRVPPVVSLLVGAPALTPTAVEDGETGG